MMTLSAKLFRTIRVRRYGLLAVTFAVLLSGCGEDEPPRQAPADIPRLTGIAAYDDRSLPGEVTAKGTSGLPRTAFNSTGTNRYSVELTDLTGPYVLRWSGANDEGPKVLYSVATQPGVANINPLTTLLFAQVMGQEPDAAYAAFAANATARVSDEKIRVAQTKLVAYLQDVLGVTVRSPEASFLTTPFDPSPGDPMFDTMQAIQSALAANGDTFSALNQRVAALARLCIEESILIDVGGAQREFCPQTKSAERDEDDTSIINYVFSAPTNDVLTVRVRDDEILSAEYVADGAVYSCTGSACGGIVLGTPASDQTRSLDFATTALSSGAGNAVLSGVLRGTIPGVALPVLPCDINKFYAILEDNTVVARCVPASDPLSLGGTLADPRGVEPQRAIYTFGNGDGAGVELVMDGNDSVVSVYFYEYDTQTLDRTSRYVCQAEECSGITLGPVTVNTDLGPDLPVLVRTVTFQSTVLAGITETGAPTGSSTRLMGSFVTVYFDDPYNPVLFPPLEDCEPAEDTVSVQVPSGAFNFCASETFRFTTETDNELRLSVRDPFPFSVITVALLDGAVHMVNYQSPVSQNYRCERDCEGVTVSPPDELGRRTVTFSDTVLHEVQSFPLPGPRTVTLNGGPVMFPAAP